MFFCNVLVIETQGLVFGYSLQSLAVAIELACLNLLVFLIIQTFDLFPEFINSSFTDSSLNFVLKSPFLVYSMPYLYKGDLNDESKWHGHGELYLNDSLVYSGHFLNGTLTGFGKYFLSNGSIYYGELYNGEFNGNGTLISKDGKSCCQGVFLNGRLTGEGKMETAELVYEGSFVNHRFSGHGKLKFRNNSFYEGSFLDGKKHGEGQSYDSLTGISFVGEFFNDLQKSGFSQIGFEFLSENKVDEVEGQQDVLTEQELCKSLVPRVLTNSIISLQLVLLSEDNEIPCESGRDVEISLYTVSLPDEPKSAKKTKKNKEVQVGETAVYKHISLVFVDEQSDLGADHWLWKGVFDCGRLLLPAFKLEPGVFQLRISVGGHGDLCLLLSVN
ncbi:hypothetical protein RCL1_006665 [Eukaryota sp. TZLM3-RCL]